MKKIILAAAISLSMAGQAESKTQYQIQIQASGGQTEYWRNGFQYVDSTKPGSVVRIVSVHDALPGKPSTFRVFVLNKSNHPITFGPENISVEYPDGQHVEMATADDLQGRLRRDIKRRRTLAIIGAAFSAQGANGYTTGSFDYNGITPGGIVSGSGSYSYYDQTLARQQQQAVDQRSAAISSAIEARQLSGAQALDSLMRRSTLQPGANFGGVVAYDAPSSFKQLPNSGFVTIVVDAGGDVHRISAKISPLR